MLQTSNVFGIFGTYILSSKCMHVSLIDVQVTAAVAGEASKSGS